MRQQYLPLCTALFFYLAVPNLAIASPLVDLGKDRAVESCLACHQVTADQKLPAPGPEPVQLERGAAPSFAASAGTASSLPAAPPRSIPTSR